MSRRPGLYLLIGIACLIAAPIAAGFGFGDVKKAAGSVGLNTDAIPGNLDEAIKFLSDPKAVSTMKSAMESFQSGNVFDVVLKNKDYFLEQMTKSGAVSDADLAGYQDAPSTLTDDIKKAKSMVNKLLKDGTFQEALADPKKILGMVGELGTFQKSLQGVMENPVLKTLVQSDAMKDLLNDPSKWAEMAKKALGSEL